MIFSYGTDYAGNNRLDLTHQSEENARWHADEYPEIIYFFADLTTVNYTPTHWYRVYKDESCRVIWMETSDRDEATEEAEQINQPLYRLYERDVYDQGEWRIDE